MFYAQDEDDGEFSLTSGGSQLANLFSSNQTNTASQSPSLTYTAPKQPKKTGGNDGQNTGGALAVLHAVAVHAFKLENQQYTSQGKVGAALIGSHEAMIYKVILYKGKQQQIATATLSPNFSFKIQANNYVSFYDDKRENWSIKFDSEQNLVEYCKQVAIARANSGGEKLDAIVSQELVRGEGQEVAMGDNVKIKYTGWLLENHTFGQEFDCNVNSETLFRIKLGTSKVIKGWEDGLLGSRKNSRRLLVIPPSLAYGANGKPEKVPPNATLIFDILINKVKFNSSRNRLESSTLSEQLDSDNSDGKRLDQSPRFHGRSTNAEDSVRSRGASLSEQMTNSPRSDKAKIISRMAKMGMPMLPMQGAVPAQQPSSESDMEEEGPQHSKAPPSLPPRTSSPKLPPKPRTASFGQPSIGIAEQVLAPQMAGIQPVQQLAVLQPQQQFSPGIPYGYPIQQAGPMALYQQHPFHPQPIPDAHLPVLLSETRTYNSEVRMALGKIMEKVDSLGSKMEDSGQKKTTSSYMESANLLQNIQRIVEENSKLKEDVEEQNRKIQTLNEKIGDLLQRNNKFVEESNLLLEMKSDSLQSSAAMSHARLLSLERDKVRLSTELGEALSTVTSLQLELQKKEHAMTQRVVAATDETQKHRDDVRSLEKMVTELESQVGSLQENVKEKAAEKESLTSSLNALKTELSQLEQNLKEKQRQVDKMEQEGREELHSVKENHRGDENDKELQSLKNELHQLQSQDNSTWLDEKSSLLQQINSLTEDKRMFQEKIENLDEQVQSLRITQEGEKKYASIWKSKCEKLQNSLTQLRDQYEKNAQSSANSNNSLEVFETDLKRIMNGLYRSVHREFDKERSYNGSDVLKTILSSIKLVTIAVLEERQPSVDEHDTKDEVNSTEVSEEPVSKADIPEDSSPAAPVDDRLPVPEAPKTVETLPSTSAEDSREVEALDQESEPDTIKDQKVTDEISIPDNKVPPEVTVKSEGVEHSLGGPEKTEDRHAKTSSADKKTDTANNTSATNSPTTTNKVSDDALADDPKKKYLFFDKTTKTWRPQPPPPPLFDDDEDDDDWLK